MPVNAITFDLDDAAFKGAMQKSIAFLQAPRAAMDQVGAVIANRIRGQFVAQQTPWGDPWKALKASTIARRRKGKRNGADQILRDTGRLMNSISHTPDEQGVSISTNVIYAAAQQLGNPLNRWNSRQRPGAAPIPARPFFPLTAAGVDMPDAWLVDVFDVLGAGLSEAVSA